MLKHGRRRGGAACKDQVRLKRDEFLRESLHQLDISGGPANVDLVVALHPAEVPKLLLKGLDRGLPFLVALGGGRQDTDPAHPFGLLPPRHHWPRRRAAQPRDESAPFHSMT